MENALAPALPTPALPMVSEPTSLTAKLAAVPLRPLLTLAAGALALAAIAVALVINSNKPDFRVLFAGLSERDNGAILAQLTQMNVPYRLAEGSGAIMVAADKVHEVRMKLSSAGLPKGSIDGYELLDKQKFGQTQAGENVSIKRALEGELMRTIGSLAAVESAKVMLALPQQNGFFREQQKPSASVVVHLHAGRTLDRAQLAGIVHLVSASVPELSSKAVKVTDGSGSLLTPPDAESGNGLDAQQLQYLQQVESGLQRRVMDLIEPVLGRENLRATITAEVDFSETMQVTEEYKPNQGDAPAAVRVQQTSESNQPGGTTATGIPGAQSNQPQAAASAPINGRAQALQTAQGGTNGGTMRRDATTNYEVDKTQRTTRNATGVVKRLSAAVVVNHRAGTDAKGKPTSSPLSEEELTKITQLVEQGMGFNKERGDTVRVVNAPFRTEVTPKAEDIPAWKQPWVQDLLRMAAGPAALAFVALLIVLVMVRPALKTLLAPPPKPEPAVGSQLSTVVDDATMLPGVAADAPLALEAPKPNENIEKARTLARENPAAMANILRTFITKEA